MAQSPTIRLVLPGKLEFRHVAVRAIAATCKLVCPTEAEQPNDGGLDLSDEFDAHFVSAFSELFNNIVMHSYALRSGEVEIQIWVEPTRLTMQLRDTGTPFDLQTVPAPELDSIPDHGLGLHIAKSFLDELSYEPGPPNVWRLTKAAKSTTRRDPPALAVALAPLAERAEGKL